MSVGNVARQALSGGAASADLSSIALLNAKRLTGISPQYFFYTTSFKRRFVHFEQRWLINRQICAMLLVRTV